jgi:hypothetical protein
MAYNKSHRGLYAVLCLCFGDGLNTRGAALLLTA